jgi:hypothetical protein
VLADKRLVAGVGGGGLGGQVPQRLLDHALRVEGASREAGFDTCSITRYKRSSRIKTVGWVLAGISLMPNGMSFFTCHLFVI